jgi:hypothetical protein
LNPDAEVKGKLGPFMEADPQTFASRPCVERGVITLSFKMEESTDGTYV